MSWMRTSLDDSQQILRRARKRLSTEDGRWDRWWWRRRTAGKGTEIGFPSTACWGETSKSRGRKTIGQRPSGIQHRSEQPYLSWSAFTPLDGILHPLQDTLPRQDQAWFAEGKYCHYNYKDARGSRQEPQSQPSSPRVREFCELSTL